MSTSYLRFDKGSPETEALATWWRWLDDNRGERAPQHPHLLRQELE